VTQRQRAASCVLSGCRARCCRRIRCAAIRGCAEVREARRAWGEDLLSLSSSAPAAKRTSLRRQEGGGGVELASQSRTRRRPSREKASKSRLLASSAAAPSRLFLRHVKSGAAAWGDVTAGGPACLRARRGAQVLPQEEADAERRRRRGERAALSLSLPLLPKASEREPEPEEKMRPRDGAGRASLRHPGSTGRSDPHARLGVLGPAKCTQLQRCSGVLSSRCCRVQGTPRGSWRHACMAQAWRA
jgi:hypothetical protein